MYSNSSFNLIPGIYDLRIYSNSNTDLDTVAVYPTESTSSFEKIEEVLRNSPVENIFATEDDKNSPANIVGYHKINPTKYLLKINNATRPYLLSFAESYDPLWQIDFGAEHRIDNNTDNNYRTNSMPLYGLTNGFYINKTGDYEMIMEYPPQIWFGQGLIVSIISLVVIMVIFLLRKKSRTHIFEFVKGH